eukprot:10702396-Alexandrium_andersonii.AAC.1
MLAMPRPHGVRTRARRRPGHCRDAPGSSDGEAVLVRPAGTLTEHPSPWVCRRPGSGKKSGPQLSSW